MKRPTREERQQSCTRKRRYRSHGDALDSALLVGVEPQRTAYRCPLCGQWHLANKPGRDR
jgi:ribosomal protein L32